MTHLAYESAGSGDDIVVLVHGFPFTSAMWRAQLDALATDGRRIIAPDLPGFGGTPGSAASMDEYADAIAGLLDGLGAARVVLAGFSMGGYVAFAFARRHAGRLRGLILVDTKAGADGEEARAGRYAMIERARAEGKGVVVDAMLPRLVSDATLNGRPDVVQAVLDVAGGATLDGIVGALTAMAARPDSAPDFRGINVPSLVIVGKEDALTPVTDAEAMAAGLADAQLVVIPEAGHATTFEQPAAVTAAIDTWLRALADW